MYYCRSARNSKVLGQSVNIKIINNNNKPLVPCCCSRSSRSMTSTLTRTRCRRGSRGFLPPADWVVGGQVEVKFFVLPPVHRQDDDQQEDEGEDEGPGPDEGEHDWRAPGLGTERGGVGVTGPGADIDFSLGGSEKAGVTAGVVTLASSQTTVTLLAILHHGVTAETGAPVVLLGQQ